MEKKKKKSANYIIPATFFQTLAPATKQVQKKVENISQIKKPKKVSTVATKMEKPILKSAKKRNSSLTLKSIHQKKEVKKADFEENFDNHPKDVFTEQQLQDTWKEYVDLLNKKGERSMASIVGTDVPKLQETSKISFVVPNKLMQDQFQKGRPKLLSFLREKLNNYGIEILVTLNETIEKKFAYTPQEKFNKLKEMNPLLDKLRQTFELDL